jgi:ketosteroid isomerase-like protein
MNRLSFSLPSFAAGIAATLLALGLGLAGCTTTTNYTAMNDTPITDYNAELETLDAASAAPSTAAEQRGLEAWKNLLADLSVENVKGKASKVYAEKTYFNDTLKTLRTADAVEEYLIETAELLNSGTVEYHDTVRSADGSYYVRWEMVYSGKKLAGGKPLRTIGMSQLRFDKDGRVVLHQDFWDSTRGIFQHIPVVGGQIRFIKNRL